MVLAVLLAPLLIADVPPVLDYPNHLARLVLLANGLHDPVLSRMFLPNWAIMPNLAVDVIGPPLLRVLPVHVAGRCLLAAVLLLNLAGVVALHRALFGRRSCWPLASCLVAYNSTFLLGFLNWQIGCGLAMVCAAGWLTWRESQPVATILAAAVASILLFFCHLMSVVFFLVLIGSAEAHAMRNTRDALVRLAAVMPVAAGPLVLSQLTTLREAPWATHWMSPHDKLVQAASPFINYVFTVDIVSAVIVYGGIALGVAAGWLTLARPVAIAIALLAVAYVVMPFDLMSASFVDTRIAIMLGFLLFAAVEPARLPLLPRRMIAAGIATLFTVRMAVVAEAWWHHRHDLADIRTVIATVPPGAAVFLTNVPQDEAAAYWDAGPRSRRLSNKLRAEYHLPALLLIERGAFWQELFANPAQQPIRLRPAYAGLAHAGHEIPPHARLVADPNAGLALIRNFDFVLMLEAGADPDLPGFMPGCLALISHTDFAALFRVRRDSPTCANGPP